jgi:hypothetical protein
MWSWNTRQHFTVEVYWRSSKTLYCKYSVLQNKVGYLKNTNVYIYFLFSMTNTRASYIQFIGFDLEKNKNKYCTNNLTYLGWTFWKNIVGQDLIRLSFFQFFVGCYIKQLLFIIITFFLLYFKCRVNYKYYYNDTRL